MSRPDFAVWAPRPEELVLAIWRVTGDDPESGTPVTVAMDRDDDGWWHPAEPVPDLGAEVDYGYLLDGSQVPLPDPRSRRQPYGVHARSRTFDAADYPWSDEQWYGRQLAGGVIYELHVGTFTREGTLVAAIERLDHLVELGVDFVELMPVNAFDGHHNWGYDGVLWYAVQEAYGGPRGYQQFVDACHQRGLAVIQDVVYNHLGPLGNYLPQFGPYLVETASNTTWGSAINLDAEGSDEVRRYILDNAAMWFRDFHVDGLRLDAVHALQDDRAVNILEDLAIEAGVLSASLGRPLPLIAESDLNDPRLITAREGGGYGLTAQWNDDFHHALYVSLTGDTSGYYGDYDSLAALSKVLSSGFYLDGTRSRFRGRTHGHPLDTIRTPTWRLVVYSDNHDQIGNRAAGERLSAMVDQPAARDRRAGHAAQPVHHDDLHGGGVGSPHALAVLQLLYRAGAGRAGGARAAGGVRRDGLGHLRGAGSAGPCDVRAVQARLGRARDVRPQTTCSSSIAGCWSCAGSTRI